MRVISSATSVRLQYTGLAIDNAIYALKGQLYAYLMAYGEDEMYGYINAPEEEVKAKLEALGFTVDEEGGEKWKVTAPKSALRMDQFSSIRDGQDRSNNIAIGTQMVQLLAPLTPRLLEVVGGDQVVGLFNRVLDVFQLPRDWRIKASQQPMQPGAEGQPQEQPASQEWVVQQITALAQQMSQALQQSQAAQEQAAQGIMTTVAEQIQPAMEALKKLTQQTLLNSQSISQLSQAVDQIGQENVANAAPITIDPNAVVGGGIVPPQGMVPIA
jgi:hypothetical protein